MNVVESHIIKPSHKDYKELDNLLFLSKIFIILVYMKFDSTSLKPKKTLL